VPPLPCDHPRASLVLPPTRPGRPGWQPPSVIPGLPPEAQRVLREALQGIYDEFARTQATPNVVPLLEDVVYAQPGQTITGVGDGQTIVLPPAVDGQTVSVVLDAIKNPVTIVGPDGTTQVVSVPGVVNWVASGSGYETDPATTIASGVPTDRLLGRDTAGTGAIEFISTTGGLEFSGSQSIRIANDGVTNALLANMATPRLKGRTTASTGDPEDLTLVNSTSITWNTSTGGSVSLERAALTGDVTAPANSNATTIANSAVTNAKLANISPGRVKGLQIDAAGAAAPVDLTGAEVGELLRLAFLDDAAGSVGTIDDFPLDARTNVVRINPGVLGGNVAITGFSLNGGGSSNNAGGFFVLVKQGSTNTITLRHATGSTGNNQLILPNARDYVMRTENECLVLHYWGGRWQLLGPTRPLIGSTLGEVLQHDGTEWQATTTPTFTGRVTFGAQLNFTGTISPTQLTASVNNYNPTGWSTANVVRLTNDGGLYTITGAAAGTAGELKWLVNVSSQTIVISHEDGASTAANRFSCAQLSSFGLLQLGVIGILYDGTSSRWRPIKYSNA